MISAAQEQGAFFSSCEADQLAEIEAALNATLQDQSVTSLFLEPDRFPDPNPSLLSEICSGVGSCVADIGEGIFAYSCGAGESALKFTYSGIYILGGHFVIGYPDPLGVVP